MQHVSYIGIVWKSPMLRCTRYFVNGVGWLCSNTTCMYAI